MIIKNGIYSVEKFIEKALYDKTNGYYSKKNQLLCEKNTIP